MNWNEVRAQVVQLLEEGKTTPEIADVLSVAEYDLRQFIHRNRLFDSKKKGRILAYEMISILTRGHPDYFRPTRRFFTSIGIGQKRWWQLYRGEKRMTEKEYLSLTDHLGITLHEALEARQLNWVDGLEDKETEYGIYFGGK